MKRIPLTQGKEALVSDCDYKYLMQWKWCYAKVKNGGYALRRGPSPERKSIYMHNVVAKRMNLTGSPDHRKQGSRDNGINNQRNNLRPATRSQNQGNVGLQSRNSSGYRGVHGHKKNCRWIPHIRITGKSRHLGCYPLTRSGKIEAAYAYNIAALKWFGKCALLNPVRQLLSDKTKRQIKRDVLQRLESFGL